MEQGIEMLVHDPTSEEAFVKARREMQEAIFFNTPTLPQSFEEFEQRIEDVMKGIQKEMTELARRELKLNLAWEQTTNLVDESWQLLFRDLAEVKQEKAYLHGMLAQLRDIISKGNREMPDATCFSPLVLPEFAKRKLEIADAITGLEKKTYDLRSGEKKLAFQVIATNTGWCRQLFIGQLIELKVQKAFFDGRLDQMKLIATWSRLSIAPSEEVSGNNSEDASSVWSRVDELENWLSTPGNPLAVIHST